VSERFLSDLFANGLGPPPRKTTHRPFRASVHAARQHIPAQPPLKLGRAVVWTFPAILSDDAVWPGGVWWLTGRNGEEEEEEDGTRANFTKRVQNDRWRQVTVQLWSSNPIGVRIIKTRAFRFAFFFLFPRAAHVGPRLIVQIGLPERSNTTR